MDFYESLTLYIIVQNNIDILDLIIFYCEAHPV